MCIPFSVCCKSPSKLESLFNVAGPLLSAPVEEVGVTITSVQCSRQTSKQFIHAAAGHIVGNALRHAHCSLLEPIMMVEVRPLFYIYICTTLYTSHKQLNCFVERVVYMNPPVRLSVHSSVHMSWNQNFSLTIGLILVKLYKVSVYDRRMCMKEDNLSPNYFKGDNLKEILISAGPGHLFVTVLTVTVYNRLLQSHLDRLA